MSVIRVSMISGLASWVSWVATSCTYSQMRFWMPLMANIRVTYSLPHSEHQWHQSCNKCWCYKSGYDYVIWSLRYIIKVLATWIGQRDSDVLPDPSWEWVSMDHQWFFAVNHGQSKWDEVIIVWGQNCDYFYRLKCSWNIFCRTENELSCRCPGGCRGNVSCLSTLGGCPLHLNTDLWPSAT
jgi:hypothetical protein